MLAPCRKLCWMLAAAWLWPMAVTAAEEVDLELVIATDVSMSINEEEGRLQREGVVKAFRSPEIAKAIQSGPLGRIGVAYIDFSSRFYNKVVVDWRIIEDETGARAFADALIAAPHNFGRNTSISDAIEFAMQLLESNDVEGTRRVIDISGDGPNNFGRLVSDVRDEALAQGVTINGLPIINPEDQFGFGFFLPDLDAYYGGCVIGGPGAFVMTAKGFEDFARAIRNKLILEIAHVPLPFPRATGALPRSLLVQTAADAENRPSGRPARVYESGCDIGERMRWGGRALPRDLQ